MQGWRPSRPGDRAPVANVPLRVLQTFTLGVDARQHAPRTNIRSPKVASYAESQDSVRSDEEESEIFVSSAEWPSSPVEGALPPDSSQVTVPRPWNLPGQKVSLNNNSILPLTER